MLKALRKVTRNWVRRLKQTETLKPRVYRAADQDIEGEVPIFDQPTSHFQSQTLKNSLISNYHSDTTKGESQP